MHLRYAIILWIICVLFGFLPGNKAHAQTFDPIMVEAPRGLDDIRKIKREPDSLSLKTVNERVDPDLLPVPIRWRGFEIYSLLDISEKYTSNLFATEDNEETDFVTTINPSFLISKDVGRHTFGFVLDGDYNKHIDNTDEDHLNFRARFNGTLEARHDILIPMEASYVIGHERREQNFATNFAKEPLRYKSFASALGISYNPNRLDLSLIGRYNQIEFDDGRNNAGQAVIRSDADRSRMELQARAGYAILPNHQPFVSVSVANTDYKRGDFQAGSFSGAERDSKSMSVLAGWEVAYKGLVEGYLGAGYTKRNYDSNTIDDVSSSKVAGNISWNMSKKATLNLALRREIAEDNQVLSAAVLSQGRIRLDYEFLHNLFFDAFVDRALADFQESSREDDIFSIGTGLRYMINPRYSVSGHYDFKARESNVPGLDYDRHQVMVRLNARL